MGKAARALFIYWKVPASQAAAALSAARAMQDMLVLAHPGLQAQLFQRADQAAVNQAAADAVTVTVTVMETYASLPEDQADIDGNLQVAIAAAAATGLAGLPIIGMRHVEMFERVPR